MTERSNFSATKGYKDALKRAKPIYSTNQQSETEQKSMPTVYTDHKKFKGFAGVDAEKMRPMPSKIRATSATKNWPALHLPK